MRSVWMEGERNEVEAHIVGTRQHHLYRLAQRLGGERRRHGIIAIEAPSEATAELVGAQHDAFLRQAERL